MLVSEVINRVRDYCGKVDAFTGRPIDLATTRDQVTYGNAEQECTGIVTCIWPSAQVIRGAMERGANLIITHEALFWNHGDHQDVLAGNGTFLQKRELLDEWGGVVWRCHDCIHAGVPLEKDGSMVDGIFYGFAHKLGWLDYRVGPRKDACMEYEIPEIDATELAHFLVGRLGLNGTRLVGDSHACVRHVRIPFHILGRPEQDTAEINRTEAEGDCLLTMEFVDFTVSEYLRDAAQLGRGKCAIALGHFNGEEPGMEYMASWLPTALGTKEVPVTFVTAGDPFQYIRK